MSAAAIPEADKTIPAPTVVVTSSHSAALAPDSTASASAVPGVTAVSVAPAGVEQRTEGEKTVDRALEMLEGLQADVATYYNRCQNALSVPYPRSMATADLQSIRTRADLLLDFLSREGLNNLYVPGVGCGREGDIGDLVEEENKKATDELSAQKQSIGRCLQKLRLALAATNSS
eukprot:m.300020 g.300020  ORF g.300020 m.300020 type:complete len:175 (-) comp20124_c0_seq3:1157-1681(-)